MTSSTQLTQLDEADEADEADGADKAADLGGHSQHCGRGWHGARWNGNGPVPGCAESHSYDREVRDETFLIGCAAPTPVR